MFNKKYTISFMRVKHTMQVTLKTTKEQFSYVFFWIY